MNIPWIDEKYMYRCLQLARCGQQGAAPNPMVGAVIVYRERIIGEGYHHRCGEAHAEVNAIESVAPCDRNFLNDSTLYVSLEPCSHFGRTPPCADLIIRTGIPRVAVGCIDSFDKVKGHGISRLRDAGIQVVVGVLEDECRRMNLHFFTFHAKQRPYITLKWARSEDGFIDAVRTDGSAAKISTPETLVRVHRLRSEHQAILVGHHTLLLDHPTLNVRYWSGRHPRRFVLGNVPSHELPEGFEACPDIPSLLQRLNEQQITSLLVEGGSRTLQSFIDAQLWDEAHEECGMLTLGSGIAAPVMPIPPTYVETFGGIRINHWENQP